MDSAENNRLQQHKAKYIGDYPLKEHEHAHDEHKLFKRKYKALKIFRQQDGKCFYCGGEMKLHKKYRYEDDYMTVDHYVPKCRGGTREDDNVVGACQKCNRTKSLYDQ